MEPGDLRGGAFGSEVTQVKRSLGEKLLEILFRTSYAYTLRCSSKMFAGHSSKHVYFPSTQVRFRGAGRYSGIRVGTRSLCPPMPKTPRYTHNSKWRLMEQVQHHFFAASQALVLTLRFNMLFVHVALLMSWFFSALLLCCYLFLRSSK